MPVPSPADVTLRLSDLPGDGWVARPAPASAQVSEARPFDVLGDLGQASSADSGPFHRPRHGFAYSVAGRFDSSDHARRAADLLSSDALVADLADLIGAGVDAGPAVAFLGATSRRVGGGPRVLCSIFQTVFVGASAGGTVSTPVDMAVLQAADVVLVVWLADGPGGIDARERSEVLERAAARLVGPGG